MTAVVALENLNQSSVIEIIQQDIDDADGSNTFQTGDSFMTNSLVKALLMASSNDAAYALANAMGKDAFIQKMNDKAKEISMGQTTFFEPSGLSYLNQSTAHDLYLLLIYIQKHDQLILDTTRIKTLTIKNQTKGRPNKQLVNINEFAGRNDFFGGKTGFIDQSGGNLVSLFKKNGRMIYIGVFGSSDRFADTETILSCIQ
jgi:D-alanyl-D-alanine endopeptidase (penicillin-binding protein 7)